MGEEAKNWDKVIGCKSVKSFEIDEGILL